MPNESNDLTNQCIAGFSILHRLGVGGMSEVYLAFQQSLHRHVALKVMRADFVGSSDHEQRFLQEARAVASLMHPNIVQVYDVGKYESIHYIAQEYVPGSNLHAYIQRRGALPLAEAVSILWQATSALQKAASIGLVHRDIKPDNLLLTPDGEVKIADFGLARARGQSQNLTAVGVTLGTPLYMSPEQIQGLTVDSRSDLYSLGATAFHMLSGRPPFTGDTALALAMQHMQTPPPALDKLRPDLPPALVAIVHKLLQKDPSERFSSAMELARSLREVVDSCLDGHVDQMVPFTGLVIDHQRISNHATTEQLQQLSLQQRTKTKGRFQFSMIAKAAVACIVLLAGTFLSFIAAKDDLFANQPPVTLGVAVQPTIQRQYALALIENDLKHWTAVSEFFPRNDAISRDYKLKAALQIARLYIEGDDLASAEKKLWEVMESKDASDVLTAIAKIEFAWVTQRTRPEFVSEESYRKAMTDMTAIESIPSKYKLVRDALPKNIRTEWDRRESLRREPSPQTESVSKETTETSESSSSSPNQTKAQPSEPVTGGASTQPEKN